MKTDASTTDREVAENIARAATRDFANHVVTQLGPNEWRCAAPGTGIMAFHVICRPGVIIVYGDVGDWILEIYEREPRHWIPAGVRSPDYLFQKVRSTDEDGKRCWYWLDAKAEIDRLAKEWEEERRDRPPREDGERANPYRNVINNIVDDPWTGEPTYRTLHEAWNEADLQDLEGMGTGFTARMYWLLECLRVFDRLERAAREKAIIDGATGLTAPPPPAGETSP